MSYYNGMSRSELASELGFVYDRKRRGYYDPADYCPVCGELDCTSCDREEETTTSRIVTARKARFVGTASEIRPGDRVRVTTGFSYIVGGGRLKYNPRTYRRVSCGPNWTEEEKAAAKAKYRYTWNW